MKAKRNLIQCYLLCALMLAGFVAEAQPVITQQPTNYTVVVGGSTTFNVSVSGAGPISYKWLCNGTNLPYSPIITTVAGNESYGYSGDGNAATNAQLHAPIGVVVDSAGNLFIADKSNNRIREVGTNGIITTVAGNGVQSYYGDGGAATGAELSIPSSMTVDSAGNLFIADTGNNLIRKVGWTPNITNMINVVVGDGYGRYFGDGNTATLASLNNPSDVVADSAGNMFIADTYNNRIRKVGKSGIITTVAGNGTNGYSGDGSAATSAKLNNPSGVAVDSAGNLFIADNGNHRIRKVGTNGIITTMAGNGTGGYSGDGGAATSAELYLPSGVAVDSTGNLYIADSQNFRIRKVGTNGKISTVAGNGVYGYSGDGNAAISAELAHPYGVAVDSAGNLFIADSDNNRIRKVGTTGIITTVAGKTDGYSGDGGAATNASLYDPYGVTMDSIGNLYIADSQNYRIRKVGTNGIISTVAGNGVYGFSGDGNAATSAELSKPQGVALDNSGNLFISDTYYNRIRKVGTNGIITTVAGYWQEGYSGDGGAATNASLYNPNGLTVDNMGDLFIADFRNNRIRKVGTNGIITTMAGNGTGGYSGDGGAATSAELYLPSGVAVDSTGNLYIADSSNNRIRKVGTNGIITTVAGNGSYGYSGDGGNAIAAKLYSPTGVAVDCTGNIFIADLNNNRIRKVGTNGIITTVAGNGQGYSGDGDAATNASLFWPSGVVVDSSGNLFIAEQFNCRIRKVWNNGSPFPVLTLSNVTTQSIGNYQVIVIGYGGSITSSVAKLTVFIPPQSFTGVVTNSHQLRLQFTGTTNYPYILQSATNLTPPVNWQPVLTNPADGNGNWQFTDTNLNRSQKFYRAVGQ